VSPPESPGQVGGIRDDCESAGHSCACGVPDVRFFGVRCSGAAKSVVRDGAREVQRESERMQMGKMGD
jgi:hypothetical protein